MIWICAHCQQSQTKPALFTTEDADYCSQACMEAGRRDNEVSQMTVYFADRMRVFEGMREADCQPVIREPLGELERLREENKQLREALTPFAEMGKLLPKRVLDFMLYFPMGNGKFIPLRYNESDNQANDAGETLTVRDLVNASKVIKELNHD